MSSSIVTAIQFTPVASVVVLFFTEASLLVSNLCGVPASTSMIAVGFVVGLGLVSGTLDQAPMFVVVSAWIVAPLLCFAIGIGRYVYPYLDRYVAFTTVMLQFVQLDRSGGGSAPVPDTGQGVTDDLSSTARSTVTTSDGNAFPSVLPRMSISKRQCETSSGKTRAGGSVS